MSRKILIIIILVLGVGIGSFFFTRGRKGQDNKPSMEDLPQKVKQKILAFDLSNYAEDGTRKWRLKGDSADIFAEIVNLNNIDMETYDEPKITLTALKGSYNKNNREISLFNDVRVLTSDGTSLITEYLKWNSDTDVITTDKPVKIVKSDVIANGNGAQAFPQMKKIILNEDVKVRLAKSMIGDIETGPQEKEGQEKAGERPAKAVITCKGPLEIDYVKNIAVFKNDVLVDDKKGKIYSDKMEAFLDPVTKNIVKVIAEGDVRVVRDEDSTYSQKAIYTTEDQKIILIGEPKIYIHSTEELDEMERHLEDM